MKRSPEIIVLSDLHLGTYGCRAKELLNYLKSVQPKTIILNGDIIDIWQFKKNFFPTEHTEVIRRLLKMAANGAKTYYLTGNHDDALRKFGEFNLGLIHLRNKMVFSLNDKTHWVFHGDIFDAGVHNARFLARLGGKSYDFLIRVNRFVNTIRKYFGLSPVSFSAKIKKKVKGAVKYISDFEHTAIELAGEKGYDYVICGHIHIPQVKELTTSSGKKVTYLNSGDWVESLTSLEFSNGQWCLYQYDEADYINVNSKLAPPKAKKDKRFRLSPWEMEPEEVEKAVFEEV